MNFVAAAYHQAVRILAKTPLKQVAQRARTGQTCVLTFHGLRKADDPGLLDPGLHTSEPLFRAICAHLAENYQVLPLADIIASLRLQRSLPEGAMAITFDDGYLSNLKIAAPILEEFGLPATIFVASGFANRAMPLWFHRLESALSRTRLAAALVPLKGETISVPLASPAARIRALSALQYELKAMPQERVYEAVEQIESTLGVGWNPAEVPDIFQPLSWEQIYQMHRGGLFSFGGHTHRHLILGRCSMETAEAEIRLSRDALADAIGERPAIFAYPNGQDGDHSTATADLLREAGYTAAMTMSPGFVNRADDLFALPRYGAPESVDEAEATVSGTYETLKEWRSSLSMSRTSVR